MIWVIWVAPMAMGLRETIGALPRVKPLANMSQKFGKEQLDWSSERRIVGIVEVNVALHVGVGHRRRQHVERGGLGLRHRPAGSRWVGRRWNPLFAFS